MTLLDAFTATAPQVRRDRYGRYLVLAPDGKLKSYTRATTVAKAIDDQTSLIAWKARMTALGLAQRPDLLALVAASDPTDRDNLNALCERAAEHGGATARRDLGTALHSMYERHCADPSWPVPEIYAADIAAIDACLAAHGLTVVASEVTVVDDELQIAGTADLIVVDAFGNYYIVDLKTGASVAYGALGWAVQLAIYAGATNTYTQGPAADGSADERGPMPPSLSRERAFIVHCEPGSGVATLHHLDILTGAAALDLAVQVRSVRSVGRKLLTPAPKPAPAEAPATVLEELRQRYDHLKAAGHVVVLAAHWPEDIASFKRDPNPAAEHHDAIRRAIELTEAAVGMPWLVPPAQQEEPCSPSSPSSHSPSSSSTSAGSSVAGATVASTATLDDSGDPDEETRRAIYARLAALEPDALELAKDWANQSVAAKCSFSLTERDCPRRREIQRAVVNLAPHGEITTRSALVMVLGDDAVQETFTTGALLGSLTLAEATALADLGLT